MKMTNQCLTWEELPAGTEDSVGLEDGLIITRLWSRNASVKSKNLARHVSTHLAASTANIAPTDGLDTIKSVM